MNLCRFGGVCPVSPVPRTVELSGPLDWIAKRIQEAQQATPVRETVASLLQEQLTGKMRERALRGTELAELAKKLIAATEPPETESAS